MYEDVTPSLIENTIMQRKINATTGNVSFYNITPCEGYVLHTNNYDDPVFDEETGEETGEVIAGYTRGTISVGYNYNFETNPFNIYAILESEVPADRIFGGGNNDHEVM